MMEERRTCNGIEVVCEGPMAPETMPGVMWRWQWRLDDGTRAGYRVVALPGSDQGAALANGWKRVREWCAAGGRPRMTGGRPQADGWLSV